MREILFRGKHTDDGHWVYGMYVAEGYQADFHCILPNYDPADNGYYHFEVDPGTVGQYTGLTDKNGKKIFEGDILSAHFDEDFPENETREVVVWDFCSFKLEYKKGIYDELAEDDCLLWEVIGNIHDNPELWRGR